MPEITFQNVVFDIQNFLANYTDKSRIKRIGLFGSVSRGEFHELIYEFRSDFL
jgi:predicted nucleotidyltransferase